MGWLQLETDIGNRPLAEIESLLEEAGALSITLRDAGDHPLLEPAPGETPLWPTISLQALFSDELSERDVRNLLGVLLQPDKLHFTHIADTDWQTKFEQELKPQKFGQRLWIIPDEQTPVPDAAVGLVLAPGMAFGTGSHPTTTMCLEWLEARDLRGHRVLDYGCGSGILGLSAALLGAAAVTLTDIDPQAITASRDNASRNGLDETVRIKLPEKIEDSVQHDVLVANILSGTLIELGPLLNGLMQPGASMAITGILADQAAEVIAAWSGWADMTVGAQIREWVLLTGTKRIAVAETEAGN